jgi:hypothetical protein
VPVRFLLALLLTQATAVSAQQVLTSDVSADPATAELVFADIENFIRAQEAILTGADPARALETEYFGKGSPGLRMFVEKYDLTPERLLAAMEAHPEAYERIPSVLEALRARMPSFRATLADVQRVIPNAVFPPTYFVVSGHRGIGSGSVEGPLLSVEKNTPESIQGGDLEPTLVHEMIHIQQLAATGERYFAIFSGEERTLLALSIREGASTFFAEIISGGSEHKNRARDYYLAHEDELWPAFAAEMHGLDMGEWLWEQPSDPEVPQDLGYAIGARIVEAYYDRAGDKGMAASEIMAITDYPAFLERSGYPTSR